MSANLHNIIEKNNTKHNKQTEYFGNPELDCLSTAKTATPDAAS